MTDYDSLFAKAARQQGYFSVEQAHECGVSSRMVLHHARTGRFRRWSRGIYRFRDFPDPPSDFPVGWLAVARLTDGRAVISHDSALYLHDLSDLLPRAVDVTVERHNRGITVPRRPPIRLHTTSVWPHRAEMEERGGAMVTSPVRTIIDCALAHTEWRQLVAAVREAMARGWITDALLLARSEARGPLSIQRVSALLAEAAPQRIGQP